MRAFVTSHAGKPVTPLRHADSRCSLHLTLIDGERNGALHNVPLCDASSGTIPSFVSTSNWVQLHFSGHLVHEHRLLIEYQGNSHWCHYTASPRNNLYMFMCIRKSYNMVASKLLTSTSFHHVLRPVAITYAMYRPQSWAALRCDRPVAPPMSTWARTRARCVARTRRKSGL